MQSNFRLWGELVVPLGFTLVARWGSPTPFESHLGLNARIEEWNAGLSGTRTDDFLNVAADEHSRSNIHVMKVAASCRKGLAPERHTRTGGCRNKRLLKRQRLEIASSRRASTLAPVQRSGRTSALPYPLPGLS